MRLAKCYPMRKLAYQYQWETEADPKKRRGREGKFERLQAIEINTERGNKTCFIYL